MPEGAGDRFQIDTRYHRDRETREPKRVARRPALYKRYKGAPTIELGDPLTEGGSGLWELIRSRRSIRDYARQPLALQELSQMLWATQGLTQGSGSEALRACPSAGGLYPVETYIAAHAVEGLTPGVYHYGVDRHQLEQLMTGDVRRDLENATLGQDIARRAAAVFVWSAVFDRCKWKYGQRAYRYIYLDAGHIGAHLALAATGLGLACCPVAAFYDGELNLLLGLDGDTESAIYLMTVARKR